MTQLLRQYTPVVGKQPVLGVEEVKLWVARLLDPQLDLHLNAIGPHKLGGLGDDLWGGRPWRQGWTRDSKFQEVKGGRAGSSNHCCKL